MKRKEVVEIELPGFANKNIRHPVEFEFQINNEWPFTIEVCLKFHLTWVSYHLSLHSSSLEASFISLAPRHWLMARSPRMRRASTSGLGLLGLF